MSIILERTYEVDLSSPLTPRPLRDVLLTGDAYAHRIHARLTQSGAPVTGINGVTACFLRADGAVVAMTGETEAGGVQVLLAPACYAVPGQGSLLLRITAGDSVVTALWLECRVAGREGDAVVDGGDVIPDLNALLSRIGQMETATQQAQAAVTSAAAFTAMVRLPLTWQTGYRIDYQTGLPTADVSYAATDPIGIPGGYVGQVDIATAAVNDSSGMAFYDADGAVISCCNIGEGNGLTVAHHVLTVPPEARSLRFSSRLKNEVYKQAYATIPNPYSDILTAVRTHADQKLATQEEVGLLEEKVLTKGWHESSSTGWTLHAGCYVDQHGAVVESADFDTYVLTPAHTFRLHFTAAQAPSTKYVSLAIYGGAFEAGAFRTRYRSYKTENTLPGASGPLTVTSQHVLAVSVHAGESFTFMSDDALETPALNPALRLSAGHIQQVKDSLGDALTSADSLRQTLLQPVSEAVLTRDNPIWTPDLGCYADAGGALVESIAYDSYVHTAQSDFSLWAVNPDSAKYLSVAVYSGSTPGTAAFLARYRCYKTENTLPTLSSPLQVTAGQTILVTVASGADFRLLCDYDRAEVKLTGAVQLGQAQAAQVAALLPRPGRFFPVGGTASAVTFDLPCDRAGTAIRYTLAHTVDAARHADSWRLSTADAVKDGQTLFPVVSDGEWELALQLTGREDFIGGRIHGSEVLRSAAFTVNGQPWTPGTPAGICRELCLHEVTALFDPADETTEVATHERIYTITAEGVRIAQRISWLTSATCGYSYICMLPILRGKDTTASQLITGACWDDRDFTVYDISAPGFTGRPHQKAHGMTRYFLRSQETGVEAEVGCRVVGEPESSISFVQNTANQYNKVYFSYCGENYAVAAGDVWAWEQDYRLNIAARAEDRVDALETRTAALEARAAALEATRALKLKETTDPAPVACCWPEEDTPLLPRVTFTAHQPGSGAASPQNVRPLTGLTSVTLCHTGRNLFSLGFVPDGATGALTRFDLPARPGEAYTISTDVPGEAVPSVYVQGSALQLSVTSAAPRTVTASAAGVLSLYLRHDTTSGGVNALTGVGSGTWHVQVEPGRQATPLTSFGQAHVVSLGETCWGGEVNWAAGTLTVTHGGIALTGAEQVSAEGSSLGVYRYALLNVALPTDADGHSGLYSHGTYSRAAYTGLLQPNTAYAANGHLYLLTTLSTPAALTAHIAAQAAAGTPLTVCYELAAPRTKTLTLPAITAQGGLNQLFLRTGGQTAVTHDASLTHIIAALRQAVGV